ncbi:mitochondrial carrier domain-containing protein [Dichotomocladium elegans]|nr:mitochondrial carrier domain-containing protein [Dichotomocladium elegans]
MDVYYLFASSVAALIARVCTHPIDTIKTRLQIRNSSDHGGSQVSVVGTIRSLYRGLPVTLLFSVPALSVYLTCYETTKASLHSRGGFFSQDGVLNHLISGCAAEVAAGTLFTPMEVMKNRLQTQRSHTAMSMAGHIWQTEGIPGFFRGYWMGLAVFVPHTMTYFAVYEQCKMIIDAAQLPLTAYLLCSSIASTFGIMLSTPLDIVKTRWQVSAAEQGIAFRQGPVAIIKHMWQQEGRWRAFTRGLGARIAWGIPTTAISMTVFELLKDWRANKQLQP